MIPINKSWNTKVRKILGDLEKEVKNGNSEGIGAKIGELLELTRSEDITVRRDATIAVELLKSEYGGLEPDLILNKREPDIKNIRKRAELYIRSRDIDNLMKISAELITYLRQNFNGKKAKAAAELLLEITKFNRMMTAPYESDFVEIILKTEENAVKNAVNGILNIINPEDYAADPEKTVEMLMKREKSVKISVKYDYFGDFILYKIMISNNTEEPIWDCKYEIRKYERNFKIRRILPRDLKTEDTNIIIIPMINAGDFKEIIAVIQPKSSQIYLEGTLYYRTYSEPDERRTLAAEDMAVDIMDETPELEVLAEKIHIVHCRELYDYHLKHKSLHVYAMPDGIRIENAYSAGKRVLSDMRFSLIMEVVNTECFYGEALFYGRALTETDTPVVEREIVAVIRCSEENGTLEINIGCNKNEYLVALMVKFETLLKQALLATADEPENVEKVVELRCPSCLQPYDKITRKWCPWCGADINPEDLT